MSDQVVIIGITGAFGSGKSTAADFFASKGYTRLTLSSFLEEEARSRGVSMITRKLLQDIANEWREEKGRGVLAEKALEYIQEKKLERVIIDGIRNTGEIDVLRKNSSFVLLSILVDRTVRYQRLQLVKRREELTPELFSSLDSRDLGIGEKETGLQVAYCIALADSFIVNNTTKEVFLSSLETFLSEQEKKL